MKHGIGLVGCGMIGRFHAKAINSIDNAKLVGCFNRSLPKAKEFAEEFACQPVQSLDELIGREDISIVSVCTASGAHLEPALAAAAAKKHVIVEKPLEVTVERCQSINDACEKNQVLLTTIFQSRFHEVFGVLKTAIDQGRFGELTLGNAYVKWFRSQEYYDSGAWRGTYEWDGGGALMNQAIHSVDLLQWLMGPVVELT